MNTIKRPKVTVTVQADPLPEGHVARITSYRAVSSLPKQPRIIEAYICE